MFPRLYLLLAGLFACALPAGGAEDLRIYVIGDTQDRPAIHDAVCAAILADLAAGDPPATAILVHTGDLTSNGDREEVWAKQYFNPASHHVRELESRMAVLPCRGNHDGDGRLFRRNFDLPYAADTGCWYAREIGPALIVVLDLYDDLSPGSAQHEWLARTLAASTARWKIAVCHEPGWTASNPRGQNPVVQEVVQPLLVEHGAVVVLSGHRHYYARCRIDGIQHLTSGGAGGQADVPVRHERGAVAARVGPHFLRLDCTDVSLTLAAESAGGATWDRVGFVAIGKGYIELPSRFAWLLCFLVVTGTAMVTWSACRCIGRMGWRACFRLTAAKIALVATLITCVVLCLGVLPYGPEVLARHDVWWASLALVSCPLYIIFRAGSKRIRVSSLPLLFLFGFALLREILFIS